MPYLKVGVFVILRAPNVIKNISYVISSSQIAYSVFIYINAIHYFCILYQLKMKKAMRLNLYVYEFVMISAFSM